MQCALPSFFRFRAAGVAPVVMQICEIRLVNDKWWEWKNQYCGSLCVSYDWLREPQSWLLLRITLTDVSGVCILFNSSCFFSPITSRLSPIPKRKLPLQLIYHINHCVRVFFGLLPEFFFFLIINNYMKLPIFGIVADCILNSFKRRLSYLISPHLISSLKIYSPRSITGKIQRLVWIMQSWIERAIVCFLAFVSSFYLFFKMYFCFVTIIIIIKLIISKLKSHVQIIHFQ